MAQLTHFQRQASHDDLVERARQLGPTVAAAHEGNGSAGVSSGGDCPGVAGCRIISVDYWPLSTNGPECNVKP